VYRPTAKTRAKSGYVSVTGNRPGATWVKTATDHMGMHDRAWLTEAVVCLQSAPRSSSSLVQAMNDRSRNALLLCPKQTHRFFVLFQVKIWFQNHRYKLKKARQEKGMVDLGGSAAGLLHVAAPPATTSPRRVSVPVLVRDGKPCHTDAVPHQQHAASQQSARCSVMPSPADYYLAAGYGDSQSTPFGLTSYGMPSAGAPGAYYQYGNIGPHIGPHPSQAPTAAPAVFQQTSSANGMITIPSRASGGSTTLPSATVVLNSFNCSAPDSISTTGKCYVQSRWW